MNKKIGILTFHYADNHGAVLQAYALRKVINSFPDCHAEIINYVPKGYGYLIPSGCSAVDMQRKREKFNRFLSEHCGIDTPMCHSVTGNEYDIYVVGSDQVWNLDLRENADYEYFLPHLDEGAKRVAYSASIGMEVERIDRALFGKYLPRFEAISLREKNYMDVISELSGKKCKYTLDPTLLLSEKDYEIIMEKPGENEKSYVLYFWYGNGDDVYKSIETVNLVARKYDLSIKHTFSSETCLMRQLLVRDGGNILQGGVGEFLWYIKNASVIITNSFHGAVFSLIFRRPLYIYYPAIRSCRQESLVELLNIRDRVLRGYTNADKLNLEMDYSSLSSILESEKKRSISYLKKVIGFA